MSVNPQFITGEPTADDAVARGQPEAQDEEGGGGGDSREQDQAGAEERGGGHLDGAAEVTPGHLNVTPAGDDLDLHVTPAHPLILLVHHHDGQHLAALHQRLLPLRPRRRRPEGRHEFKFEYLSSFAVRV